MDFTTYYFMEVIASRQFDEIQFSPEETLLFRPSFEKEIATYTMSVPERPKESRQAKPAISSRINARDV